MKITLTDNQSITFIKFLDTESATEPKNFREWGEEWIRIRNVRHDFGLKFSKGLLTISLDDFWAIFNYLSAYASSIKDDQLGKEQFTEMRDLFIHIHSFSNSSYPPGLFCRMDYDLILERVYVNPNINPADLLPKFH